MNGDGIDLEKLLVFNPKEGTIYLQDYRMVMFSACALGVLRRELVDTLGWARARGLFKRFGYASGLVDGRALIERFPDASREDQMVFGPLLHALEGATRMRRIPERSRVDLEQNVFHVEAVWENSYEAEQHIALFGPADEPVCWGLAGYARGHSTAAAGRPTHVKEVACRAMGHNACFFIADFVENVPDEDADDYRAVHLPEVVRTLEATLKRSRQELADREARIDELNAKLRGGAHLEGILGTSAAMCRALETVKLVAPVDSTVLILGESGTGKELLARAVHKLSERQEETFLPVNCAVLPENLQEAELFGYARGAFSGAVQARPGFFESADNGTLFLDEIGDLSLSAQTKILRALQEGEVKRIGETKIRKVNVRIIAATHRDLDAMVKEGTFREDLYYRLEVVTIRLPPLRDRENDALILADHFLAEYNERFKKKIRGFDHQARRILANYRWPGNVRELRHAVERAVIMATGRTISPADLPERIIETPAGPALSFNASLSAETAAAELAAVEDEATRIRRALDLAQGNKTHAAKLLGIGRSTLWRKLNQTGLN
ncbi:MAG: sigma 54-interacting transcriptional regulator [Acidobacteriota bacterium]|nr:sigma 54-interacting transcriptional regulator [Acidobacteriota bacterium]